MWIVRKIFLICLFPIVLCGILLIKLFFWNVPNLLWNNPETSALMALRGDGDIEWINIEKISPNLARAVVASEDSRFYEHSGIDWLEMRNAFNRNNLRGNYQFGGSTITMQLAKNLYLSPHKNILRKALEIPLALKIDADLPKNRILEIYLNIVEWGPGIYGAEAAAKHYFKKSAAALTPYESAFLAVILPNPLKWGKHPPGPYVARRIGTIQSRMNQVSLPKN